MKLPLRRNFTLQHRLNDEIQCCNYNNVTSLEPWESLAQLGQFIRNDPKDLQKTRFKQFFCRFSRNVVIIVSGAQTSLPRNLKGKDHFPILVLTISFRRYFFRNCIIKVCIIKLCHRKIQ